LEKKFQNTILKIYFETGTIEKLEALAIKNEQKLNKKKTSRNRSFLNESKGHVKLKIRRNRNLQ